VWNFEIPWNLTRVMRAIHGMCENLHSSYISGGNTILVTSTTCHSSNRWENFRLHQMDCYYAPFV